jgi:thiamine biosynthesis lipoprotein
MGTVVTVEVIGDEAAAPAIDEGIDRALSWFHHIEASCSRFDPSSEVMRLTTRVGEAVRVSAPLFEAVRFSLAMAEESGGAFDPVVGAAMERRGFDREHRTGTPIASGVADDPSVSFRDVRLGVEHRAITLVRPVVLDLGAVAKGLAVDMAAHELRAFENFAIDAGGDLYLAGTNANGEAWRVGIRHPRADQAIVDAVRVSNRAVCTSGDYERIGSQGSTHILDARTRAPSAGVVSVTTMAPTAMLADAAGTAAFALGPADGISLLERLGVDGMMISSALERFTTRGFPGESATAILPDAERSADDHPGAAGRDSGAG